MSRFGLLLLVASAVITSLANLLLRAGLSRAGGFEPDQPVAAVVGFVKLLAEPLFAIGFTLYFIAALVWFRVIAQEPLSTAYPVLVGLTFVMVSVGALLVFREEISTRKVVGLLVVLTGIAIASSAGPEQVR